MSRPGPSKPIGVSPQASSLAEDLVTTCMRVWKSGVRTISKAEMVELARPMVQETPWGPLSIKRKGITAWSGVEDKWYWISMDDREAVASALIPTARKLLHNTPEPDKIMKQITAKIEKEIEEQGYELFLNEDARTGEVTTFFDKESYYQRVSFYGYPLSLSLSWRIN
jgi:hypothetical protein